MTLLQALVLGTVQGATEFIPVSSSAHLVLVPWLLRWPAPSFAFDVLVQWGTLAGVIVYFRRDVWAMARAVAGGLLRRRPFETGEARLGWLIALATVPAAALGWALKEFFEAVFGNPRGVAALLLGTAAILVGAEVWARRRLAGGRAVGQIGWRDAMIIGLWQAASILPGISRSGATIGGGMFCGLTREAAARFSFLMSIPVMLGAGLVAARDLAEMGDWRAQLPAIAAGFAAAAVVGFAVIHWLLRYLGRGSLYGFAVYCLIASAACLLVSLWR